MGVAESWASARPPMTLTKHFPTPHLATILSWFFLEASLGSQGPGLSEDNLDLTDFQQPRCGVSGSWGAVRRHRFPVQGGQSTSAVLPSEGQPLALQKRAGPGVRGRPRLSTNPSGTPSAGEAWRRGQAETAEPGRPCPQPTLRSQASLCSPSPCDPSLDFQLTFLPAFQGKSNPPGQKRPLSK